MNIILPRVVLILILAIAIWQCITIAIAAGITRSVSFSVGNTELTPATAKLAARRLNTVMSVYPDYIPALYLLERVTEDVPTSIDIVKHITAIQPREPRAWGRLFQLSLEDQQTGEEITSTLDLAEQYGRWDPVSNWLIVDAGTRYWLVLNRKQREKVLQAGARALVSSASFKKPQTTDILKERGFLSATCSLVPDGESVRVCRGAS